RNAMRTFRVDRIKDPRMTIATFTRPQEVELERTLAAAWDIVADQPLEEIVLRFTPEAAPRASETRWHPSQVSEREADGSLLWRARVSGLLEIRAWILSWGDGVEVLKPPTLRDDVARILATAAARYRNA
ncbi:MAG: WYL domain-containing protein, partial [Candidatus Limnocylindrus sp.]